MVKVNILFPWKYNIFVLFVLPYCLLTFDLGRNNSYLQKSGQRFSTEDRFFDLLDYTVKEWLDFEMFSAREN